MSELMALYESILLSKLKNDDQAAFTIIFTKYYPDMVRFSFGFTRDPDVSEEIVQDVFLKLWENRNSLEIHTSLKSFLLKTVQNRCIDSLRHEIITHKYASLVVDHPTLSENDTENYLLFSELENNFDRALGKIPAQYAEVFRMSRFETLNYLEIATKLGISVRTVEVRISKALSLLRRELKDFLLMAFLLYQLLY
jgi:RNA polymerase sigma-70 factor (family 1)